MTPPALPAIGCWRLDGQPATEMAAAHLAARCRTGDILALRGPLGAGKTAFARAFIRARLHAPELVVPSPTFTLVQTYPANNPDDPEIWHIDLYRIDVPEELMELGLDEAMGAAIMLIEWPERMGSLLPVDCLHVDLAPVEGDIRMLRIGGSGDWPGRLAGLTVNGAVEIGPRGDLR